MIRYAIVIEKGESSYGAYVPDLPGCVAVGKTEEEVRSLLRDTIDLHLESLREEGIVIPEPHAMVDYVEVKTAA